MSDINYEAIKTEVENYVSRFPGVVKVEVDVKVKCVYVYGNILPHGFFTGMEEMFGLKCFGAGGNKSESAFRLIFTTEHED